MSARWVDGWQLIATAARSVLPPPPPPRASPFYQFSITSLTNSTTLSSNPRLAVPLNLHVKNGRTNAGGSLKATLIAPPKDDIEAMERSNLWWLMFVPLLLFLFLLVSFI